ncbi:uncharacterized [Tachysurus ichikawai]
MERVGVYHSDAFTRQHAALKVTSLCALQSIESLCESVVLQELFPTRDDPFLFPLLAAFSNTTGVSCDGELGDVEKTRLQTLLPWQQEVEKGFTQAFSKRLLKRFRSWTSQRDRRSAFSCHMDRLPRFCLFFGSDENKTRLHELEGSKKTCYRDGD